LVHFPGSKIFTLG
jgi:hypothetical protein